MDALGLIQKHESLRLVAYDDANNQHIVPGYTLVGHPRIGYGRSLDVDGISPAEASSMVSGELVARTADLKTIFVEPSWSQMGLPRQAALLDLHYALTPSGLRDLHQMVTCLLNRDWANAAKVLLDTPWAKNDVMGRAAEDAAVIETGDFA